MFFWHNLIDVGKCIFSITCGWNSRNSQFHKILGRPTKSNCWKRRYERKKLWQSCCTFTYDLLVVDIPQVVYFESLLGTFIKNGLTLASFSFIDGLFKQTRQFLQKINAKNVHPVYSAGIWTNDLLIMSRQP